MSLALHQLQVQATVLVLELTMHMAMPSRLTLSCCMVTLAGNCAVSWCRSVSAFVSMATSMSSMAHALLMLLADCGVCQS